MIPTGKETSLAEPQRRRLKGMRVEEEDADDEDDDDTYDDGEENSRSSQAGIHKVKHVDWYESV
jgi:hypothetical protein